MSDAIPLSAREFAAFYGISRERLSRIVELALRDRGGIFGLADLGYFRVEVVDAHRMEITPTTATRAQQEANPPFALKGRLIDPVSVPDPAPAQSASAPASSDPDAPSKYELERRVLQERATALRQKNVLEQARLREETVSYCSAAVHLILTSLRADIDSIRLDPASAARLREAIDNSLADLQAVLPDIIAGTPVERIELDLSARRADRITASRVAAERDTAAVEDLSSRADRITASSRLDHAAAQEPAAL